MIEQRDGQGVFRIESALAGSIVSVALGAGAAAAAGFATYNRVYNLPADHVAQLQKAENAADAVLGQYDSAMSSLPKACKLVIRDAMNGSLDSPLDIITAANQSGVCQGNMNEITTVTYQYHDKMLQAQEDIAAANTSLEADRDAATTPTAVAGVAGFIAGCGLGMVLVTKGIPIGERKKDKTVPVRRSSL